MHSRTAAVIEQKTVIGSQTKTQTANVYYFSQCTRKVPDSSRSKKERRN